MWNNTTEFQKRLLAHLNKQKIASCVKVESAEKGIRLEHTAEGWHVFLEKENMLGRAAVLLEENAHQPVGWCISERPAYERLGVMLDCSRNAVPKVETVKRFLCMLSQMGYNTLQLYMEDVYELEGYPYFGYGRGRYTTDELKQLDAFACELGIELIPAIQTLAHLGQALKWKAMRDFVDVGDILLIDSPKTYEMIEKMFSVMRECFSTKHINIGMDEAHMVGLGKYLDQNGYKDRTQLMLRHFAQVHKIANSYEFEPMMWSDMFFRLASGGDYYDPECAIDPKVAQSIPSDTTLVYWDYYSEDEKIYDRMLERHAQLSSNVIFAGGAWKWSGFAPGNAFSMKLANLAHHSCVRHGIREVLVTMWGDNGAECSLFAVLPALQYWAELCWEKDEYSKHAQSRMKRVVGADWSDFMQLDELIYTPDNPAPGRCGVNATKTLLYEDILMPLFSPALDIQTYVEHLHKCVCALNQAAEANGEWKSLFICYKALAQVLVRKMEVQLLLGKAWREKDKQKLKMLCDNDLAMLETDLQDFINAFHAEWLAENKPAGLDVFDVRVGGQMQRIKTARERLTDYISGEVDTLEELDQEWLPFDAAEWEKGHKDMQASFWHEIASPSSITLI